MNAWSKLADEAAIATTIEALAKNGITATVAEDGAAAKAKVLEIIPKGAQVMTMTSMTLSAIGVVDEFNDSGNYDSVRAQFAKMDQEKSEDALEMRRLGVAPEWTVGSAHAVTQDGSVVIASNTGSQLPAYAYGAGHVVWVVGAQKIVKNFDEAMKRIYEYVLPLESERANKAYNITTGSNVSKLLVVNKEVQPGRISIILVKEKLGF
ncbi:MAG: lactate utilization protein [Candidatus Sungbacteria bacterium]|nr:lactate utilization protein [Candidatus Sungbacteria bacterium]